MPHEPAEINVERLTLVVVGAHLRAEAWDRPIAADLRRKLLAALDAEDDPTRVLVCTDIWYLNQRDLRQRPTISVGAPGVNAFTAYLADRLPTAFAVDNVLSIQYDVEGAEPLAACWGATPRATHAAVRTFEEKYLPTFLRA